MQGKVPLTHTLWFSVLSFLRCYCFNSGVRRKVNCMTFNIFSINSLQHPVSCLCTNVEGFDFRMTPGDVEMFLHWPPPIKCLVQCLPIWPWMTLMWWWLSKYIHEWVTNQLDRFDIFHFFLIFLPPLWLVNKLIILSYKPIKLSCCACLGWGKGDPITVLIKPAS